LGGGVDMWQNGGHSWFVVETFREFGKKVGAKHGPPPPPL